MLRHRKNFYLMTKLPIFRLLAEREHVLDEHYRDQLTCSVMHSLILQPSMEFQHVWTKTSHQPVCIGLDRRIYFNNHKECYFNDGCNGVPHKLYQLVENDGSKIWAVISYHCHIRCKPTTDEEKEVCLLVLTSDGFLKVLNADTGAVLRSIYISNEVVFRYLQWADYVNTVQIKSVQAARQQNVPMPPDARVGRVMSIMIFKIHPLEVVAYMHIEKQVFGDVRDVSIFEDLLVVILYNRTIRYYSFTWILENCQVASVKLGMKFDSNHGSFIPGVYPNSIPVTIIVKEAPPILFETVCNPEVGVSFGGVPTVYIHSPKLRTASEFIVCSLSTGQLVGKLASSTLTFHPDVAEFHFEDYQRLLHISGIELSCYKLVNHQQKGQTLKLVYNTNFKKHQEEDTLQVSSRGRLIHKRKRPVDTYIDDFSSAIQDLDYENELELLYAVVTQADGCDDTIASLCFIDDQNGQINKTVDLTTWNHSVGNSIYYELDCILHLEQSGSTNKCHFYQLTRKPFKRDTVSIIDKK